MRRKKEKKKLGIYVMGGFVVMLMVFSILGLYDPSEQEEKVEFNGYRFYRTGQGWFTRIGDRQVSFFSLPAEVENISMAASINLNAEKVYLVGESKEINVKYPIDRIKSTLYYFTNMRSVDACFSEEDCPANYPIVDCESAQAQVIYFKESEENVTKSYTDGQCVVLESGSNSEMERLSERLIYKIHGIMG